MSGNQDNSVDKVTQKTAELSLNAGAKEFVPKFNVKAPVFTPRAATTPAAVPAAAAPANTAAAPKTMSIKIGSTPTAKEEPAKAEPAKAEPAKAEPVKETAKTEAKEAPSDNIATASATATSNTASAADTSNVPDDNDITEEEEMLLNEHFKEHMNVIFIGHVDAGKSTLGGNILFLTEMVDKRTMEKYEREAKEAGRES
ncbi:translation termination factor GTPase eRF3, partial [Coemansia sp. RSA 1821]